MTRFTRASSKQVRREIRGFLAVGTASYFIDFLGFNSLLSMNVDKYQANFASLTVAGLVGYFGNRFYSFSHSQNKSTTLESLRFVSVAIISVIASQVLTGTAFLIAGTEDQVLLNVLKAATVLSLLIFRFSLLRHFVFRTSKASIKIASEKEQVS